MANAEQLLAEHDVALLRADNPGLLTLSGTNSYLIGRNPTWLIDPGPASEAHLHALLAQIELRGSLAGILLTHDHPDHCCGLEALLARAGPVPVAAGRGPATIRLADGADVGPCTALHTPGHAPDHFALLHRKLCFTGDAVLGEGSVFVAPEAGALAGYLQSLRRLQALDLELICPGHGPPVTEPQAKIAEYMAHREERERMLLAALQAGARSTEQLLDAAWSDVPAVMRPAAEFSLRAHLHKLAEESRLPEDLPAPAPTPAAAEQPKQQH